MFLCEKNNKFTGVETRPSKYEKIKINSLIRQQKAEYFNLIKCLISASPQFPL
jgi:hypothetical protein